MILRQYINMLRSCLIEIESHSNLKSSENLFCALVCAAFDFPIKDGQSSLVSSAFASLKRPSTNREVPPTSGAIELLEAELPKPLDPKLVDIICATRTPPAQKKSQIKRQGAKTVKAMEKMSASYVLSSEDATTFRALSARANFLAQDRTDIGYSTKELCREFSVPNRNSQMRLKRVVRYLAGEPRLVYKYNWGSGVTTEDRFDIYVDTDFAGCKESRRSTSGGIVTLNGSNVKH